MNDLNWLVNYKRVIRFVMSPYTLKTNELTHLSTFIDRMVCHIHIGCLYEWSQKSCHSQMCYPAPRVPIHIENEWSYPLINFFQLYVILYVYIVCLYQWFRLPCLDPRLATVWYVRCLCEWSCQSLVCYPASNVLIHLENEWSYPLIEFYRPYGILLDACMNDLVSRVNP